MGHTKKHRGGDAFSRNRGILEPFAGGDSAFVGNAVFFAESKALSSCVRRICFVPSQKAIFV